MAERNIGRPIAARKAPFRGLPPHEIAAEEAVIAALLLDDSASALVAAIVRPADFFREQNAWIYDACLALAERGEPITLPTVAHELDCAGRLDAAGGEFYLVEISGKYFTAVGVEAHARIVANCAIYRMLIGAAQQIAQLAYAAGPDPRRALDQAQEILTGISRRLDGDRDAQETVRAAFDPKRPAAGLFRGGVTLDYVE